MKSLSRKALFAKLNTVCFQTLEGATVLCKLRGNPWIELSHWVCHLLDQPQTDWHVALTHLDLDVSRVRQEVLRSLERLPAGSSAIRDLSETLMQVVERAWLIASVQFNRHLIRSGDLLLALLSQPELRIILNQTSPSLAAYKTEVIAEALLATQTQSSEHNDVTVHNKDVEPGEFSQARTSADGGAQEALRTYTTDLTELARQGRIDPVLGRVDEIRQMVDILQRRRQNNPLIAGEAGVGKTALVEGLALAIVQQEVPEVLRDVRILSLDLGLLQAGASMKGEFEHRLRQVIDGITAHQQPVVLFIDEVHTLVGAGGQAGTGDAANLLKPALARGNLRTIGATTWSEYKRHIEKDPALTRRFQVIQVDEPSIKAAQSMLRGLVQPLMQHHGVFIHDEAVCAAVELSQRYIPARQLPDKAISLLDTACARVSMSQSAMPVQLARVQQDLNALALEKSALLKEQQSGADHSARLQALNATELEMLAHQVTLSEQWQAAKNKLGDWLILQSKIPHDSERVTLEAQTITQQLASLTKELQQMQGDSPLVFAGVDEQVVAQVVADWTGIPVGRMVSNELAAVLSLAEELGRRVLGQDHALKTLAERIQINKSGLEDPNKPIGVFLLAGSSGVGKTETALALAETLYGGESNLITINMSEFQEAHTVSSLKGAPPGYVGYGEGGVLTEAVRRKPYSVVLLDEVEKAHPDVHELFFQVFDKGWMEDGEGRRIDFRNTLIILTTNCGTETLMDRCREGQLRPPVHDLLQAIQPDLLQVFPPAFLGRVQVVPFYPLSELFLGQLVTLQLNKVAQRLQTQHQIKMTWDSEVIQFVVSRCNNADSGGRMVATIINQCVLPPLSRYVLDQLMSGRMAQAVELRIADHQVQFEWLHA